MHAKVATMGAGLKAVGAVALGGILLAGPVLRPTGAASAAPPSPNGSRDKRQSPYYKGYDFYAASRNQGKYGDGNIHPWHIQGNVWLLAGEPDETNIALQVGNDGGLVVDTGTQQMAPKLLESIQSLLDAYGGDQQAIRWIINTDGAMDHVGGNYIIRNGGNTIVGGNFARDNPGLTPGATVISNINMLTRMVTPDSSGKPSADQGLWPNETHTEELYSWDFNDEAVRLYHPTSANTDGNEMVLFRRSDVIATGDVVDMTNYPVIDRAKGGTIDGELAALNEVIRLAVADFHHGPQEGGTMIVPGHGRLCDQADVIEYTIILTTIRNRIMYYKNQGKTLQQVLALKPSSDFDGRWGPSTGPWTAKDFVEAVYETLPAKGKGADQFEMNIPAAG